MPISDLNHLAILEREPINKARHRGCGCSDDAAQQAIKSYVISPNRIAAPEIDNIGDKREDPKAYRKGNDHRVDWMSTNTCRTCHCRLLPLSPFHRRDKKKRFKYRYSESDPRK